MSNGKEALRRELSELNTRLHYARGRQYARLLAERDKVQAQLTAIVRTERVSDNEFLQVVLLELNEMDADDGDAALDYLASLRSDLAAHFEPEVQEAAPTKDEILAEIGALREQV